MNNTSDLPRFTFPLSPSASTILNADDATFHAFAQQVGADDSVLSGYTISDKETLRELLSAKVDVQLLTGDLKKGALAMLDQIRGLQEKPAAKLTSGLTVRALAEAYLESGSISGLSFEQTFQHHYGPVAVHSRDRHPRSTPAIHSVDREHYR